MLNLIAAAALAAAQPGTAPAQAEHQMPMKHMGMAVEHKAMDCCKHCKDMATQHEGESADHSDHQNR